MNAREAVERTARDAYARLAAYLAVRWRDSAAVEDALADAFESALKTWPDRGVPAKPESWLLQIAKRRLIDRLRREQIAEKAMPELAALAEDAAGAAGSEAPFPDDRLKMLLLCAHPQIDPAVRTPLMLNAVLRIDAARIASAFVLKPSTMSQRLTRAKAKIRSERLTFVMPGDDEWPQRLNDVLEAIFAAYGAGWDDTPGENGRLAGLSGEAIRLARLLADGWPAEAEAQGLLAFMLHVEARRPAGRDEAGRYVPLSGQDPSRWSAPLMAEAERRLVHASRLGRIGRYQLMAAIQSLHAMRAVTGRTEWREIALLYEGLARLYPALGVRVGRAAAMAEAYGVEAGLTALAGVPKERIADFQPYWALAAHLCKQAGRTEEALDAYSRAIGLADDPAVRRFLAERADECRA